jgi:ubiquinone/menaquinone biosynthesis C-methylase UbiE
MDARDLKFEDASFDLIVDKGLFDSVACGADAESELIDVVNGAYRLLRPGGKYVLITHGTPNTRLPLLQRKHYKWSGCSHSSIGSPRFD